MNKILLSVISASIGVVAGLILSRRHYSKIYEEYAESEIMAVRKKYLARMSKGDGILKKIVETPLDRESTLKSSETDRQKRIISESRYKEIESDNEPYVITPDEFGELDDYETISLTYYSDGVLADDENEKIDDISNTVGDNFAEHFGEFEDDSVFIRNESRSVDFEILYDSRTYYESKREDK